MIRPVRMKRFYIAVPQSKEEEVAEILGRVGTVEIFSESSQTLRGDKVIESYASFLRIADRTKLAYETVNDLLPKKEEKLSFSERVRKAFTIPYKETKLEKVSIDEINNSLSFYKEKIGLYTSKLDDLRKRLGDVDDLLLKVDVFRRNSVSLDTPGDYTHIFVKAGFIPEINIDRLREALKPFNVIVTVLEGRPKDKFILIAGSQKDKESITNILTMLNMEEITVPKDIEADPEKAYESLLEEKRKILSGLSSLKDDIDGFLKGILPKIRYIRFMYNVRSMSLRTRNLSIFYGWVPSEKLEDLSSKVSEVTGGLMHIEAVDPDPNTDIKPPTHLKHLPIINKFQLIVRMRGIPNYYEIDPTIFFTILFPIMYGIMFGDIGEGVILFILGLMFAKMKKPFLGISYRALNRLGVILSISSIFSIIFGFLYGESFLIHFMNPIWLDPIETKLPTISLTTLIFGSGPSTSVLEISVIAIIFGVLQLFIALGINIANELMNKNYLTALLSWKGVVGVLYYLIGITLTIHFIFRGMKLEAFGAPENIPLVVSALALLIIGSSKPTIENIILHKGLKFGETMMEGVSDFIEMFITYITNSISYVRLGAFAIAHVALAEAAYILAPTIGFWPSYIIFNIIVILIEGFSAGIQSIRLLFYEFSTKFYRDEGRLFRPIHI